MKKLCLENFDKSPAVYFVLYNIVINIEEAFEGQAMPKNLYDKFDSLKPAIDEVLAKKNINSLDLLTKSFVQIKGAANFFV
ncbi:MAG: hypothetical protein H8D45_26050 [Bacteroidetes bacterium]|nr:hypothetical protein [Bacteroidota bacterium]